jgi:hypothetical protein
MKMRRYAGWLAGWLAVRARPRVLKIFEINKFFILFFKVLIINELHIIRRLSHRRQGVAHPVWELGGGIAPAPAISMYFYSQFNQ